MNGRNLNSKIITIFCLIAALPVLSGTSLGAIYPILKETLHFTGLNISMIVAASTIALFLTSPFIGRFADRRGVLKVIFPVLLLYVTGAFLNTMSAFVSSGRFEFMLVGRILQGIGAIGTGALAITFLRSQLTDQASPSAAWIEASASAGAFFGPLIGGIVATWRWYAIFIIDGSVMLLLILLLYWIVTTSKIGQDGKVGTFRRSSEEKVSLRSALSLPIRGAYFSGFGLMFSLVGMQIFLVDYLKSQYSVPILFGSMVVSFHALLMAVTAAISGQYLSPQRSPKMILTGLLLFSCALVLLGVRIPLPLSIAALILSGIGCGLILPPGNITVLHEAPKSRETQLMSLSSSFRSIGVLTGSAFAGWLSFYGYKIMFILSGVILGVIAGSVFLLYFYGAQQKGRLQPSATSVRLQIKESVRKLNDHNMN